MHNRNDCPTRQAIGQQQQQQASVFAGKEPPPAHQASLPQVPQTTLVYPSRGYTAVPQHTATARYNPYQFFYYWNGE